MRIVHLDNLGIRRYGQTKVGTGRKLFNGMIRNNWKVHEFSIRDISTDVHPENRTTGNFRIRLRLTS